MPRLIISFPRICAYLMASTDPTRRSKLFCHKTRRLVLQLCKLGHASPHSTPARASVRLHSVDFVYRRLVKRHGLASQTRGRNLRFVCERPAKFLILYRCWHWCTIVLDRTMAEYLCRNKLQMIKDKVI